LSDPTIELADELNAVCTQLEAAGYPDHAEQARQAAGHPLPGSELEIVGKRLLHAGATDVDDLIGALGLIGWANLVEGALPAASARQAVQAILAARATS
jgi:hypothetical protein